MAGFVPVFGYVWIKTVWLGGQVFSWEYGLEPGGIVLERN